MGRDADIIDIIDLNYKKEWDILFKNQIISGDYSKKCYSSCDLKLVFHKGCSSDDVSAN